MIENLNNFLKKYNYKPGIVPFSRLKELEDYTGVLARNLKVLLRNEEL